jgi:hypothetical protein
MPDPRSREKAVADLHQYYNRKQLRVLVGNGVSIPSGFPPWDGLNLGLLEVLIRSDSHDRNLWAGLLEPALPTLTRSLYDVLGKNGAADFVRMTSSRQFKRRLAKVLYGDVNLNPESLTDAQRQLAAMSAHVPLLTTNFDPLLEMAIADLKGSSRWERYRTTPRPAARSFRRGVVEHVHGWIEPAGGTGGHLILTESDYFNLAADDREPANRRLRAVFERRGAALIVGMSMQDPNIRRLLYVLRSGETAGLPPAFLVLKKSDPVVDGYTSDYWKKRAVRLIFINDHEELAGILRDVQWGVAAAGQPPNWLGTSAAWLESAIGRDLLVDSDWQALACNLLATLRSRVRRLFAIPAEEECHFGLFVPLPHGRFEKLSLVATSRDVSPEEAASFVTTRSLEIRRGKEQGAAGLAFTSGRARESLYGDTGQDFNFTPEMTKDWVNEQGFRDWRSVLAVPLLAGKDWTPVAVVTLTSNLPQPFWRRFGGDQEVFTAELLSWMRQTARKALGGFAQWIPIS